MRLFVALFPPEDVRDELRQWVLRACERPVRLTPVERWHVTLEFLGEVPAEDLVVVERAVGRVVVDGSIAWRGIRLRLAGGGSFGRARSAAVWAGVDGDLPTLRTLQADLRASLAMADLPHGDRSFSPHLTVTYRNGTPELHAALQSFAGRDWTAGEIALVRSHHTDGGGYETLRTWPLT